MSLSIAPLVIGIIVSQRLRKFCKASKLQEWERLFTYTVIFSILLFGVEAVFNTQGITKYVWDIYLSGLILFALKQTPLRPMRMFLWAFAPYIGITFAGDVINLADKDIFTKWNHLSDLQSLSFIWLAAILFSYFRQAKTQEKERVKQQQQDELNRAIAIRKVELEQLVSERTAELIEQKEALELTLNELKTTQSQLIQSEKMASLGELTAGIAHEIQNPLNFVNNFSEVSNELLDEMKTELASGNNEEAIAIAADIKQNLEKINHHGKRADAIVKGMLLHSRKNSAAKEPTDINALADEYLRLAYHGLRAKDKAFNATLETDFDPLIGAINIMPQDMGRVFLNLINNAFYTVKEKKKEQPEGYAPTVSVSTKKRDDKIEIKIKDNGDGIPEKAIDKIFQPFFTTKPTGEGTGLGLSLSYDIVKAHNGEITVKTRAAEGTEFTILLPAG